MERLGPGGLRRPLVERARQGGDGIPRRGTAGAPRRGRAPPPPRHPARPVKIIIDSVLGGQAPPWGWPNGRSLQALLFAACAVLVLTYAALGALVVLNNYTTIGVGQRMVSKLRSDLYGHLHRLSLAFHTRARVGDLIYRVTADTFALQSLTMNCLFPAVTALTLLAGMGVIMLRLDRKP